MAGSRVAGSFMNTVIMAAVHCTRAARLDTLDDGVIPVFPAKSSMQISLQRKPKTVTRGQYPITAAYCFTDYRPQGQTIPRVIVDIASPPTGKLSLFNLYVALLGGKQSCCCGSLMTRYFWKRMSRSWCWKMRGWMTWTRRRRSGGKKPLSSDASVLYRRARYGLEIIKGIVRLGSPLPYASKVYADAVSASLVCPTA